MSEGRRMNRRQWTRASVTHPSQGQRADGGQEKKEVLVVVVALAVTGPLAVLRSRGIHTAGRGKSWWECVRVNGNV